MAAVCIASWLALASLALLAAPFWIRYVIRRITHRAVWLWFTESYSKNLMESITALRKFGLEWTVENELRAQDGRPLFKPIGTARPFPHFDGLLFSPAQLQRRPLDHISAVSLETVVGRRATRPMVLSMPVMVTAMGYGVALSKPFARAIARGSAMVQTACNTGQGPVLPEFRDLAHRLVIQYHGGAWRSPAEMLSQADMIEIRLGQGANAGCGTVVPMSGLPPEVRHDFGLPHPEDVGYIPAGLPEVQRRHDLKRLVRQLRQIARGAPIAVKLAASHHLEQDLRMAADAGADVIVIDGAQGGTHSSPAILVDDFGLPTLAALCRAVKWLRAARLDGEIDLVVSGGIRTPGDALKAIALGADAVYIGTAALFATMHTQITKVIPFEPPTQLAWADGAFTAKFDEEEGAQSLAKFLTAWAEEMRLGLRALGKTSLHDVDAADLVAWQPEVARITGLPLI